MKKRVRELMREGKSLKEAQEIVVQEEANKMVEERIGELEEKVEELEDRIEKVEEEVKKKDES